MILLTGVNQRVRKSGKLLPGEFGATKKGKVTNQELQLIKAKIKSLIG
ncbi:hypothetical protein AZH90_004354 [Salmonella enterica subsp. enterica serovar Legon]|nr:hypothetical protein [Salmonella enterica subsp. enterica serovar Legon]EDW9825498.1 hypothetical protein [Salmonella enterica]EHL5833756.1 hypothetical protein [Salmonella enterica]